MKKNRGGENLIEKSVIFAWIYINNVSITKKENGEYIT